MARRFPQPGCSAALPALTFVKGVRLDVNDENVRPIGRRGPETASTMGSVNSTTGFRKRLKAFESARGKAAVLASLVACAPRHFILA